MGISRLKAAGEGDTSMGVLSCRHPLYVNANLANDQNMFLKPFFVLFQLHSYSIRNKVRFRTWMGDRLVKRDVVLL